VKTTVGLALFATMMMAGTVAAADVAAGQSRAAACAGCHGSSGIAGNPMWPNLAGQNAQYFIKQMQDFRDGRRSDPMMASFAAGVSDEDIENLAAYYASLD
jgi:cytochrome c553